MSSARALERVRIVLFKTNRPGNIGAAARAMKTMGLSRLYLVSPRHLPHPEAEAFAAGAADVLHMATHCDSLDQALAGTVTAVAATSRPRTLAHETLDCREACRQLTVESAAGDVALVFGPERTGLTRSEIGKCRLLSVIPANPGYASLNIAQAVQVFAYELRMASLLQDQVVTRGETRAAAHEEVEHFFRSLEQMLHEIRFLDPANPRRMMQRLRRLFARARLESEEINILMGLLRAVRSKVE